jgi:hypothetical protein
LECALEKKGYVTKNSRKRPWQDGKEEAERNLVRFIVVSFARCQKSPLKLQNTPTAQFQQQKDKRKNSEEPKIKYHFSNNVN